MIRIRDKMIREMNIFAIHHLVLLVLKKKSEKRIHFYKLFQIFYNNFIIKVKKVKIK